MVSNMAKYDTVARLVQLCGLGLPGWFNSAVSNCQVGPTLRSRIARLVQLCGLGLPGWSNSAVSDCQVGSNLRSRIARLVQLCGLGLPGWFNSAVSDCQVGPTLRSRIARLVQLCGLGLPGWSNSAVPDCQVGSTLRSRVARLVQLCGLWLPGWFNSAVSGCQVLEAKNPTKGSVWAMNPVGGSRAHPAPFMWLLAVSMTACSLLINTAAAFRDQKQTPDQTNDVSLAQSAYQGEVKKRTRHYCPQTMSISGSNLQTNTITWPRSRILLRWLWMKCTVVNKLQCLDFFHFPCDTWSWEQRHEAPAYGCSTTKGDKRHLSIVGERKSNFTYLETLCYFRWSACTE